MTVAEATKMMQEYEHVGRIEEHPILYVYKDKEGYSYNYTLYMLAVL